MTATSASAADCREKDAWPDRAEIQAAVDRIAAAYGAVGVEVGVIRNGQPDETYACGSATKGVEAMTADTKIRIASISKVVLAMTAMCLYEDGVINPDADISLYWGASVRNPYYPKMPVTIRTILSHTSSIKAFSSIRKDGASIRRNLISGDAFNRAVPGSIDSWCYNNYGFAILGMTLELASRETVNSIAGRELFKPLGIDASFGSIPGHDSRFATLYFHSGAVAQSIGALKNTKGSTYPGQRGICFAGGLMISAADLAKLVAVLAADGVYEDQQILRPSSVALMETVNPKQVPNNLFYQGLPLRYQKSVYGQNSLYYHTGSSDGVFNLISYNPETRNGVVVLTTGASGAKDSYGIYKICGEISSFIYKKLDAD